MKIRIIAIALIIIAVIAFGFGCGSATSSSGSSQSSDSDESELSEGEATALSEAITSAAVTGMNAIDANALELQDPEAEVFKTVQCSQDGSTCTYDIPLSYRLNCTAGGRIEVSGSLTGTTSDGSGLLQIGATETISDWECVTGYVINGDPYISLAGTFSFLNGVPSTQQSMTISGGFKWGLTAAESCQISLSINFGSGGSGTVTGTVCGYTVDATF